MTTKIALTNIADTALATLTGPKITTIVYPGTETATDTAGGETINLTGNGFQSGCSVLVGSTAASVVTFISTTQISFVAPAMSANTYVIYVINPDGGTAISIPGISYSGTPNWTTAAGSLGTVYETGSISTTVTATGDAPITYTLASGTLPTGSTLSTGGSLSGTAPATASATTYNFTITAKDAQNQTTNRAFSLTINPDVVSWSSPASLATYSVFKDVAIANVTMSATSAAGGSITYTADTLPTGLSISGANIAGTPTVTASTTTVLTATATSTRTATRTINWVVSVANDTFFKNTTLLLNGETTVTPFISDASTNSFGLTINGDTKPTLFSPYQGDGYYSNYFNGTTDVISVPNSAPINLGSSDFTIEGWFYFTSFGNVAAPPQLMCGYTAGGGTYNWALYMPSPGNLAYYLSSTGGGWDIASNVSMGATISLGRWYHIALVRNGNTFTPYINGVAGTTTASSSAIFTNGQATYIGASSNGYYTPAYISNVRIVKGTAVYTSVFTPSTTPLTAISGTGLLTCQSNRFIDKSTNALAVTIAGTPQISPAIPFAQNSSYSTYGSAYFDGSGDNLSIPNNVAFQFGTGDYTVEGWMYIVGTARYQMFYHHAVDAAWTAGATLSTDNGPTFGFWWGNSAVISTSINRNTWYHVALTRVGNLHTLYMNGTSVGTYSVSYTYAPTNNVGIGAQASDASYALQGFISNLRVVKGTAVYTSTFTPPTTPLTAIANTSLLTLQYNGGANNYGIIDNGPFNNIITRAGNTSQGTFSPYSQTGFSNLFGSTSDYLQISSTSLLLFGTGDFTIEAWVYHQGTAPGGGVTNDRFIFGRLGAVPNCAFFLTNDALKPAFWDGSNQRTSNSAVTPNTWVHISVSRVSNNIYFSVNGTVDQQSTSSVNFVTASVFNIGRNDAAADRAFPGYISNLRVVKGTGLYSTNFTPSTSPLTPVTNTILLTCQSNRFVDNSSTNFALTPAGTPSVQTFSPFAPGVAYTPSVHGGSMYLDGTGDYLDLPAGTTGQLGTAPFTIEFWTYGTDSATSIIFQNTIGTPNWAIIIVSGSLYWQNGYSTSSLYYIATSNLTTNPLVNAWTHIAITRDTNNMLKWWINGVGQTALATPDTTNYSSTSAIRIGAGGYGDHTGYLSDIRITKGVAVYTSNFTPPAQTLTNYSTTYPSSLLLNFTNGGIIDQHSSNVLETVGNAQLSTAVKKFGNASMSFNGTSQYLTTPTSSNYAFGTGDFTFECWVYTTVTTSGTVCYINGNINAFAALRVGVQSNQIYLLMSSDGTTWGVQSGLVGTAPANSWNHIAITRASGTVRIFINGAVLATTYTFSTALMSGTVNTIGAYSVSPFEYLNGYIDDLRITKGYARYTANFTAPTSALITK
jgi:hypothetical protein